ncbi:cadherin-like domain-containing protein [Zavarzinia marina]|uniref:cadherin-like domain-containing protein n=1 Tax=Zavarzinia marina TaxID=2911065 RepID=UPI0022A831EE|nr:cadherin-like domain-containing protein [Zavarzinia marina]
MNAFVTIETDDGLFFGRPHQAAVATARADRRKPAPRGKTGAGVGIASLGLLLGACSSDDALTGTGRVVKDYVAGADVFVDGNGNGVMDPGEAGTTTDADGAFEVPDILNDAFARTATGGVDTGSGVSMEGVILQTPAGGTVISPLTTLIVAGASAADVAAAFGLDPSIDLLSYDPQAGFLGGDANAAAVLGAGQMAMISMRAIAALTGGSFTDAATRLADTIAGGALDLTDKATVEGLLAGLDATLADRAASLLAAVNGVVADQMGAPLDPAMQAASLIGQTLLLADLASLAANPTEELWSQLQSRYDGASLDALLAGAEAALPGEVGDEVVAAVDFLETQIGRDLAFDGADLLANDVSLDGDALTLTGVSVDPVRAGDLSVVFDAATGTVTVTPAAGFSGITMFEYSGEDAEGNAFTGVVLVDVGSALITDGPGDDVLIGDDARNLLISGAGDDLLIGAGDDDRLISFGGNDALDGGSGDDILVATGELGSDMVMRGGSGNDYFVLAPGDTDSGLDIALSIVDFAPGEDKIDLSIFETIGTPLTIDDILSNTSNVDGDAVIDLGALVPVGSDPVDAEIVLVGVDADSLGASDFVLEAGVEWHAGLDELLSAPAAA